MLKTELLPNEENIKETLLQDVFRRNIDVLSFIELLNTFPNNVSIAIDGPWGTGKTFFIRQVEYILKKNNQYLNNNELDSTVKTIFTRYNKENLQNELTNFIPIYFDAWKYDNNNDPIISLLYEIVKNYKTEEIITSETDIGKIIFTIFDFFTGLTSKDVYDAFTNKTDLFEKLKQEDKLKENIKKIFDKLREEKADKVVIFIDELDRCKPTYAVSLLERIKHYFDIQDVYFVFAINNEQLQYTIKQFYGNNFDAIRYLDRFFDFQIKLPNIKNLMSYENSFVENGTYGIFYQAINGTVKFLNLTLREIPKFYQLCNGLLKNKELLADTYDSSENLLRYFSFNFIIPFAIGLRLYKNDDYIEFMNGNNFEIFENYIKSTEGLYSEVLSFCDRSTDATANITHDDFNYLKYIYNNLFGKKENHINKNLHLSFSEKNKNIIYNAINYSLPSLGINNNG